MAKRRRSSGGSDKKSGGSRSRAAKSRSGMRKRNEASQRTHDAPHEVGASRSSSRSGRSSDGGGQHSSSRSSSRSSAHTGSQSGRRGGRRETSFRGRPAETMKGTVQKNPRGFAFIIPLKKGIEDAFLPAEDALGLLTGDVVEFSVHPSGKKTRARIHKVIERGKRKVVGEVVEQNGDRYVKTLSSDYFWIPPRERAEVGHWVLGDIVSYPTKHEPGTVRVVEDFGNELTPKQDLTFAIANFGLYEEFSSEANGQALKKRFEARQEIDAVVGKPPEKGRRRDMTKFDFVTIDGPDAKDFDDAVLVETPTGGSVAFILYVAIADVSFFVTPGSPLDVEARKRATSVYFPGFCLPMLPESLSNDLCSLRPREQKLAMVAEIHFDREALIVESKFYDAIIETKERLTYELANAYAESKPTPHTKYLKPMRHLFKKMWAQRVKRGSLDFSLRENKVEVDHQGTPLKIAPAPNYESNRWIEEFMVAANRVVAKSLRENNEGALYRVHEVPEPQAKDELNRLFKAMGISYRLKDITNHDFSDLLKHLEGNPKGGPLNYLILRHQKQAQYFPEPLGHFGLALEDYCHFTSPIRRYPDLVVHRAMRRLIQKANKADTENAEEDYYALGQHCSQRERVATDAERWVVARKQAWFFQKRVGDIVEGVITGMNPRGLYVDLEGTGAEGLLEYERFPDAVTFDEEKYLVYRKGGKPLSLGDPLTVLISAIRWDDNRILLDLAQKL